MAKIDSILPWRSVAVVQQIIWWLQGGRRTVHYLTKNATINWMALHILYLLKMNARSVWYNWVFPLKGMHEKLRGQSGIQIFKFSLRNMTTALYHFPTKKETTIIIQKHFKLLVCSLLSINFVVATQIINHLLLCWKPIFNPRRNVLGKNRLVRRREIGKKVRKSQA